MFYVYILKSKEFRKTYVGITTDFRRRLKEHNSNQSHFTSIYGPWEIVYIEQFERRTEARKKEKYFKSAAGRRFIKKQKLIPE
jgi:putative endonuclease